MHNPSDHPLKDARLAWTEDVHPGHPLRICGHGVAHPDYDDLRWRWTAGLTVPLVHECCESNCCQLHVKIFEGLTRPLPSGSTYTYRHSDYSPDEDE